MLKMAATLPTGPELDGHPHSYAAGAHRLELDNSTMVNRREFGRGIRRNPNVFLQQDNMEYIMQACARGRARQNATSLMASIIL
jgi:hypothetical protein